MGNLLHVLILEDSESDVLLLLRELRRGGYTVEHEQIDNAVDMARALDNATWDVILSDYSMLSFSASDGLRLMKQKDIDIPFIIISGTGGEDVAVEAMKAGAHDFFAKHKLTRLIPAIERELCEAEERRKRKQVERELVTLYNASAFLFGADNLLVLGRQIVQAIVREFGEVDCKLILVDKQERSLIQLACTGKRQIQTEAPLYLDGSGLIPEVARGGQLMYIPDVSIDPRCTVTNLQTRSELIVPLRTADKILGVLDLQRDQLDAFSLQDQRILAAFAERAAAMIEIIGLYEEAYLRLADLE